MTLASTYEVILCFFFFGGRSGSVPVVRNDLEATEPHAQTVNGELNCDCDSEPVSYTHLDVYNRQEQGGRFACPV